MAQASVLSMFSLVGQTALVTGGTRGIGQAVTLALAEVGADIILVQRDLGNIETKKTVEALGRKATIYTADLSSQSSVAGIVPTILKDGYNIQILVNCAGINKRHPSHQFPDSDLNEVMQVNLNATFALGRDVGAHILAQPLPTSGRRGSILNFGSLLSFQGGLSVAAYAASKGAVAQLTKALNNEWAGQGITVNAIAPGYVVTDMNVPLLNNPERLKSINERIPAGSWGKVEDFKAAAVFVCGSGGAHVSGHVLAIDGAGLQGRFTAD
ncbi:2-deoxy-d-gluconate 3-dehydrogenase-like protein [Stipitochalara longipes BDJ]|nr:2-deoxy-d-gluconate 3-dehydrogenase-like protein [Stipitochalara longipes BDJ]